MCYYVRQTTDATAENFKEALTWRAGASKRKESPKKAQSTLSERKILDEVKRKHHA